MDVLCENNTFKVNPKPLFAELPETYTLSPEQLKFYDVNGYLVLKELIDFTSLYSYKNRFIQICKGVVDSGNITVVKEPSLAKTGAKGEDLINKIQDILYDEVLSQYTENPRLLHVLSQFIGDRITAIHSMLINKPPGTGRHPPHQDLYYFPYRPADKIIASWTAIDHVTIKNGCLFVVPGSHKAGVMYEHGHLKDSNKLYHGILQEDTVAPPEKRVPLEMSPGDTVFFHPLLVHGSGPNVSKNFRKSISCHYASSDCHFADVRGTVQQKVAEEIEAEARRRGFDITYENVGKFSTVLQAFCRGGKILRGQWISGYKEFFDEASLNSYRQRFIQICRSEVPRGGIIVVKEPSLTKPGVKLEDSINKVQDIVYDDVFSKYTESPKLLDIVSQLIGDNVVALHSMLINKPPGTPRHPPHQKTANQWYYGILEEEAIAPPDQRVDLVMDPGDTVFFQSCLVHGSGPNVSKKYRKAMTAHFAASECYTVDIKGTPQETIEREILAVVAKRGWKMTFPETWLYKMKRMRGVKCNL